MNLKEILELGALAVGTGAFAYGVNELRKQYVNCAEKNKFYDENIKFDDLENKSENIDGVNFEDMKIKKYSEQRKESKSHTVNFYLKGKGNPLNFNDWKLSSS